MIIERNVFRLKFGKAKESIALWKAILATSKTAGISVPNMQLLSDISGPAYTLVVELHINSFLDVNPRHAIWSMHPGFQELYQQFIPLCESAHREYYKIEAIV